MSAFRTWVEVDHRALRANLRAFRRFLPSAVKIAPVVKADAYGHSVPLVTAALQNEPIWGFCVAYGEEALALRARTRRKILVLSSWQKSELPALIQGGIHVVAWDALSLQEISAAAARIRQTAFVHLKIDTGDSRIGVRWESFPDFLKKIKATKRVVIAGVFAHFSDSEENATHFTEAQLQRFRLATKSVPPEIERHIACTAATVRFPPSWLSFVRIGLGLYGLWPSEKTKRELGHRRPGLRLRPVLQWKTTLLQVKDLPPKTPVGYGLSFRTSRRTRLGVLPVGYWDGYARSFGNRASVLVAGKRAPIIGRVCMNLTMVDLTNVPKVKAGERVTLLGMQGKVAVTAEELASIAETINYEIVTRINPRLPRVNV